MMYEITEIHGPCPMYAEGTVYGYTFRFRARGSGWYFEIVGLGSEPSFYIRDSSYAPWPEAGYMSEHEARRLIDICVGAYYRRHELS
jgi:hypothetical protein